MIRHITACMATVVLLHATPSIAQSQSENPTPPSLRIDRLDSLLPLVAVIDKDKATLQELVRATAPFLWPTGTEVSSPRALPQRDRADDKRFVFDTPGGYYYTIRKVSVAGDRQAAEAAIQKGDLPNDLTGIEIRYFFYYPEETGAGAHRNDLETAEMWLLVATNKYGSHAVYLWQAFGAAHGLSWSTNFGDLSRVPSLRREEGWPTPFDCPQAVKASVEDPEKTKPVLAPAATEPNAPLWPRRDPRTGLCLYRAVFLVEEGKHATAPDLNRDGYLTPMIDLNANQSDAWGIRDSLGTDSRVSPTYRGDMFVPRRPTQLWVTDEAFPIPADRLLRLMPSSSAEACDGTKGREYLASLFQYQGTRRDDEAEPRVRKLENLKSLLNQHEFCRATHYDVRTQVPSTGTMAAIRSHLGLWRPRVPYGAKHDGLAVAFRFDRGIGGVFTAPVAISPPFVGGWLVFKVNLPLDDTPPLSFGRERGIPPSLDLVFLPSSTRKVGWYGGGGWEWARDRDDFDLRSHGLAWEFGFKVRATETRGFLWSGRIGYRFNGTERIRDQRFIAEVGVGAW